MMQKNNADINPAQTDSSKTAAKGLFSLNINIASITLVKASPIAERNKLRVMTVHRADAASIKSISSSITAKLSSR
jgi:hypothetical protein